MGGFGIMKFLLPMLPVTTEWFKVFIYVICIIGMVYASATILRQIDVKKMIAYSSVAHMSIVCVGLFSYAESLFAGFEGAFYMMITHGVIACALFSCIGVLYERYKTRTILYYTSLAMFMPLFSIYFFLFILGNISFPGTGAFVAEFLILFSLYTENTFVLFLTMGATVLGVAYNLWLYVRVCFGPIDNNTFLRAFADVNERENFTLILLALIMIYMGICPEMLLSIIREAFLLVY